MPLHPELEALGDALRQGGAMVVPHGDHLCVRLPMFSSVRLRRDGQGALRCEARFGLLQREVALVGSTAATAVVTVGAVLATGAAPVSIAMGLFGLLLAAHGVARTVITEGAVTRAQLLWATRPPAALPAPPPAAALPAPGTLATTPH